jgi:hypothetical protein
MEAVKENAAKAVPVVTKAAVTPPSPLHAEFAELIAKMQGTFGPQKTIAILRRTVALLKEQS